jgi:hypothetical protein
VRKGGLGLKARARLISAETERFSAVLQHAAFQASPFETIEKHLANSAAAQANAKATKELSAAAARVSGRPASKDVSMSDAGAKNGKPRHGGAKPGGAKQQVRRR